MIETTINTPNGNEYSRDEHIAIARRTKYYSRHGVVLTRRNYSLGGMTYQVNSLFCPSADEGLRRLMQQEIEDLKAVATNVERFVDIANKYTDLRELTSEVLRTFIERIIIHERTAKHSKTAT